MTTSLPTYTGDTTSLVQPTGNPLTDALLLGSKWGTGPAGTGATVTFTFPDGLNDFDTRPGIAGNYNAQEPTQNGSSAYLQAFAPFGAAPQTAARTVLDSWASVVNLRFNEVAPTGIDAGALRFAFTAPPGVAANMYGLSSWPQDLALAGDTWMNSSYLFPEGWAAGTQNYLTLLHEVGHAIGLKHPHDAGMGGSLGWPVNPILPFTGTDTLTNYSTQDMVMAYNDVPGLGSPLQADFAPTTPMRVDIAAVQHLYGANLAFNAGNTIYSFSSTARYNQTVWDGGGTDTFRVDGDAAALINLIPGTWSQLGLPLTYSERNPATLAVALPRPDLTDARTVFIYDTVLIENAMGGGGKDIVIGNQAANQLSGGGGNDELYGGLGNDEIDGGVGNDTASYLNRLAAHTLSPSAGGRTISGPDGADSLINIERLQFADAFLAFDTDGNAGQIYRLYKAAFARTPDLAGLGGWIAGMDGGSLGLQQVASGFIGSAEFQNLYGANSSNNQFITALYLNVMGRAPDSGGFGYWLDQLSSSLQTRAQMLVNFSESGENKAAVAPLISNGILYASAEQAAGPARGQAFNGTAGVDTLIGGVGNDSINGAAGNDTINGGAGIDISLYGGNRSTHTVTRSDGGLTVSGGNDGTDTLLNVERLKFADIGLAFDIDGNAGQTYRLYQAAFKRTPDTPGLSDWIRGMDNGMSLRTVASGFIGSAEFQNLYGARPTDAQFVNLLYANVLNRAPDQAGSDYWLGQMQGGMTREIVLIGFSESAENQAALIGVIQDGIAYITG